MSFALVSASGILIPYLDEYFHPFGDSLFSLYRIVGACLLLRLIPPMLKHVFAPAADYEFTTLASRDQDLCFYFLPNLCSLGFRLLGLSKTNVLGIVMVITGVTIRHLIDDPVLKVHQAAYKMFWAQSYLDCLTLSGIFIRLYENVGTRFYLREVALARAHREAHKTLPDFHHSKLESERHIRLLLLKPRKLFTEPICELVHVGLDDDTLNYEALSYTWGEKPPSIPLLVNGCRALVTSGVEEFLFSQRSITRPRLFWIDAICIDQGNADEKNQQLPLMAEIYQRADRVIVWLGPVETPGETTTFRNMIGIIQARRALSKVSDCQGTFDYDRIQEYALQREIAHLFLNPWFERIWIVQEVAVGRVTHVMYRGLCMDWDIVVAGLVDLINSNFEFRHYFLAEGMKTILAHDKSKVFSSLATKPTQMRQAAMCLNKIRYDFQSGQRWALFDIIRFTVTLKSTNPRDKLFALLGLLKPEEKLPFAPSYHDSVEDVFMLATCHLLAQENWFEVLVFISRFYPGKQARKSLLPSWSLDYQSFSLYEGDSGIRDTPTERLQAGKVIFPSSNSVIQLQCAIVGVVATCTSAATLSKILEPAWLKEDIAAPDYAAGVEAAKRCYLEGRRLSRSRKSKDEGELDREFWQACTYRLHLNPELVPEHSLDLTSNTAQESFEHSFFGYDCDYVLEMLEAGKRIEDDPERNWYQSFRFIRNDVSRQENDEQKGFLDSHVQKNLLAARFCLTSTGNLALIPGCANEGDIIAHVRGGCVPVVLRRMHGAERQAQIIGTSYVVGVDDIYSGDDWEDWLIG